MKEFMQIGGATVDLHLVAGAMKATRTTQSRQGKHPCIIIYMHESIGTIVVFFPKAETRDYQYIRLISSLKDVQDEVNGDN